MKKLLIALSLVIALTALAAGGPFQEIWEKLVELEARLDNPTPATSQQIEELGFVTAENLPSFSYPDGIATSVPVTLGVAQGNAYVVPAGKNLYILGLSNQYIGGSASVVVDGVSVAGLTGNYLNPSHPIMVGAGSTLSANGGSVLLHGFVVDATVTPVVTSVLGASSYTVPADKTLYITSLSSVGGADVRIDGNWFIRLAGGLMSLGQPVIMGTGQVVTSGGGQVTVIGYLR